MVHSLSRWVRGGAVAVQVWRTMIRCTLLQLAWHVIHQRRNRKIHEAPPAYHATTLLTYAYNHFPPGAPAYTGWYPFRALRRCQSCGSGSKQLATSLTSGTAACLVPSRSTSQIYIEKHAVQQPPRCNRLYS